MKLAVARFAEIGETRSQDPDIRRQTEWSAVTFPERSSGTLRT
jgi:hypothetical protein